MKKVLPLILAVLHTGISFFTDRMIFSFSSEDALGNYIPCKVLMFVILYMFWKFLFNCDRDILKYCAIYLIPIAAVLVFKLPQGFLSNDEHLIFEQAVQLADYTWFYYLTTWYYIITMMMIPSYLGPIIVKVVIQVLMCGYCVFRVAEHTGSRKRGAVMYIAFLLPPILAYTTSAHRIPVYIYLYLFLMFTLYMDMLENRAPSKKELVLYCILIAILTQWRTEGIYLAVFGPVLLFIAYPSLRKSKKSILAVCFLSLFIQYVVAIPQNGLIPTRMNDKADNRMGPFYAYTVTNMVRNGLDPEKNAEDLLQIDRYLNMETVKEINYALGDINYEDTLILYYPGYIGLREEATDEDYRAYVEACKHLFINNPDVFARTRIGSFDYAATVYDIRMDQGLPAFIISIIKTIAYNLYIPMVLLLVLFVLSVILWLGQVRRGDGSPALFTAVMTLGLFAHWFIVFVLAPASYFKYYFPIYFTVYFWYILLIAETGAEKNKQEKRYLFPQKRR